MLESEQDISENLPSNKSIGANIHFSLSEKERSSQKCDVRESRWR